MTDTFARPEVTLLGRPVAGTQILDGCLVDLHIPSGHDPGVDVFINRPQPIGGQPDPARHALAWDGDVVPGGVDLLLPIERQRIAVFRDNDLREQSRRAMLRSCKVVTSTVAPPGRRTSKAEAGAACATTCTKRTGG